jgi:hypothetical protein
VNLFLNELTARAGWQSMMMRFRTTETDMNTAWFYNFGRGAELLNRHSGGNKSMAMSVRCIKVSG